ncbi:enoyl-CoA hydratase/isomerase family protein [Anaerotruncus rubiinfantis]|uniref:enoyl-CoA hydratase/isomerase family protein n=1 Tax=Anaerotruncus rubiinfantis TaxID=1720200 RepID=UPI000829AF1C|nr:enoyl-CoA hydratase-related protein [Anaerotruncus rubiinfantis]
MQQSDKIRIDYFEDGRIARITLDNPPVNLTTVKILDELLEAVITVSEDDRVRVLVLTAAGERIFCGGSDLKEFPLIRDRFVEVKLRKENAIFSRLESMGKPVIAAINAMALGGGCEMALACDFIVMDERAKIGQPEINIGTFPGSGATFRLTRRVGPARALELLCLGTAVPPQDALEMGLVNRIAPAGKSWETAYELALELAAKPKFALKCIKELCRSAYTQTPAEAIEQSLALSEIILKTPDSIEGTKAFLEKRPPVFQDAVRRG